MSGRFFYSIIRRQNLLAFVFRCIGSVEPCLGLGIEAMSLSCSSGLQRRFSTANVQGTFWVAFGEYGGGVRAVYLAVGCPLYGSRSPHAERDPRGGGTRYRL